MGYIRKSLSKIGKYISYHWHKYWYEYHVDYYYFCRYVGDNEDAKIHDEKAVKHMYRQNDLNTLIKGVV